MQWGATVYEEGQRAGQGGFGQGGAWWGWCAVFLGSETLLFGPTKTGKNQKKHDSGSRPFVPTHVRNFKQPQLPEVPKSSPSNSRTAQGRRKGVLGSFLLPTRHDVTSLAALGTALAPEPVTSCALSLVGVKTGLFWSSAAPPAAPGVRCALKCAGQGSCTK